MKIFNDKKGYLTSIMLILLLIPLILLVIITIEENNYNANNTIENIKSDKLDAVTKEFEDNMVLISIQSVHNITKDVLINKTPLKNSSKSIKELIQDQVNNKSEVYKSEGYIIDCEILEISSSDDPFKLKLTYNINSKLINDTRRYNKTNEVYLDLINEYYPVYDPLPVLKTNADVINDKIVYEDNLMNFITLNNNDVYNNSIESCILKKCPYEDYSSHGHSKEAIINCISNHYYHESHDGLCLLCRLEAKDTCPHMGLETFIVPTLIKDEAPVSIDHVLLNSTHNGQYSGNKIILNNTTIIYLDNGHKTKYGL